MKGAIDHLYENVMEAFEKKNLGLKDEVEGYEDLVDSYESDLSKNHIARLHNNTCSAESGGIFLSIVSNMERVADHFRNVFYSMTSYISSVKTKAVKNDTSKEGNDEALVFDSESDMQIVKTDTVDEKDIKNASKQLEEDKKIFEENIEKEPLLSTAQVVENKKSKTSKSKSIDTDEKALTTTKPKTTSSKKTTSKTKTSEKVAKTSTNKSNTKSKKAETQVSAETEDKSLNGNNQ